jgi:hypothetical protein
MYPVILKQISISINAFLNDSELRNKTAIGKLIYII